MSRSVKPWVGKSDNTAVPPRVRLRNFEHHAGMCWICGSKIQSGQKWETDHKIALINGGKNEESNLAPAHDGCHLAKSKLDVANKASASAKRQKHLGIRKKKSKLSVEKAPKPPLTKSLPPKPLYRSVEP